jgi:hypothetical protein
LGHALPRIGLELLDTQGNTVGVLVVLENLDLDFLADRVQLGGWETGPMTDR